MMMVSGVKYKFVLVCISNKLLEPIFYYKKDRQADAWNTLSSEQLGQALETSASQSFTVMQCYWIAPPSACV